MHNGGEGIVRRLAHIDVVVRMHGRLAAALAGQDFVRTARYNLIGVHIGLGA